MPRSTQYNNITTSEIIEKINPENIRLKNDFLTYLQSTQRSDGTIKGYNNDLLIFFAWNLENNKNKFFVEISKRDIVSFQNWLLTNNQNSPARVRRLKSALSSLGNYVENILDDEYEGYRSIVRKVENPVGRPVREKTVLSESQIKDLLDKLVSKKKFMQACVVALAAASGARKTELLRFKLSFFTDDNLICGGSIWRTSEPIKTKGRGLGKYIQKNVMVSIFKPYLDFWMQERSNKCIESEWLFPDKHDPSRPMSASTLNGWTKTFSNYLGVPFYFHCLRHYLTTYLAKKGIPDGVIVSFMGWDSAEMCSIYKDIDATDELEQWFGADGFNSVSKTLSEI